MDENKIEPSIFRYILKHTKKNQILLILLTLISMPFVYVALEVPKIIINSALSGEGVPGSLFGIDIDQIDYLLILCSIFLLLVLINGGLKYVNNLYRGVIGERMLRRFRYDMFSRLLRFPITRFKQLSQTEIIPMVTAEAEPLGGFIGDAFALPAFQGGLLLTYLGFIFIQDFWLGLAAIALYPFQLYIIPKLQRRVNELSKQRVQAVRKFADKVGESVSGISDIHVNDTSKYEYAHVSDRLAAIYHIRYEIYRKKFFIKFINNFLGQLTPFFFYAIGGYFVINGELSLGSLVAVLAAYKDLDSPWKELLKFYQITEDVKVKYAQIIDQFQPDNMLEAKLQANPEIELSSTDMTLRAAGVGYSEDEHAKTLEDVSFSLDQGLHVGIVSGGGSGRGVLAQLIVRLLKPEFGTIKLAGNDIANLPETVLGQNLSYVDQQSYVFTGTVKENILYGLKNIPVIDPEYSDQDQALRERQLIDSIASNNSTDDINADWINTKSLGFDDAGDFNQFVLDILDICDLRDDVYEFGVHSVIDTEKFPELTKGILQARLKLEEHLQTKEYSKLIEILHGETYKTNLSAAENLLLGVPMDQEMDLDRLIFDPRVQKIIEEVGLKQPFISIGIRAARLIAEMFSDVPDGSPLFQRFNIFQEDDMPILSTLGQLPDDVPLASLSPEDTERLMGLTSKLTVARHRLGLITPEIQQKIMTAHALLKERLGSQNDLIEFYDYKKIAAHLTIEDNMLFGRIAFGQPDARKKVGKLLETVIDELGLVDQIIQLGLNYSVGVGGSKLTPSQRQKLTIARALIKNPKILVVNEATSVFEKAVEKRFIDRILQTMKDKTVLWVLGSSDYIEEFDRLVVLDKGKLAAEGTVDEIKKLDILN